MPRTVDPDHARRIAVRAQLLDGSATGVLDTVRRLGYLQIDPIATVATPQELVLWSRLGAFDREELDRLLWAERQLFEWDALIWPIESLPMVRAWTRAARDTVDATIVLGQDTSLPRGRSRRQTCPIRRPATHLVKPTI
jgi:uncharacterized protein YcaQ